MIRKFLILPLNVFNDIIKPSQQISSSASLENMHVSSTHRCDWMLGLSCDLWVEARKVQVCTYKWCKVQNCFSTSNFFLLYLLYHSGCSRAYGKIFLERGKISPNVPIILLRTHKQTNIHKCLPGSTGCFIILGFIAFT